jgi:hypothetical protein
MASLTFFKSTKIIEVDAPQTEVTVQDLTNQIRDYEDNLDNMDIKKLADITGKDDLGGGNSTGITLKLLNNWRVRFENRCGPTFEQMRVSGGNLIATNVYCNNPIATSSFTQVTVELSLSPSITGTNDTNIKYLIESSKQKPAYGRPIYWDPYGGDDGLQGCSPDLAVKTWAVAKSFASSGTEDIIFILATDPSGITTITERIEIDVPTLRVRGSGTNILFSPSCTGGHTVRITADDVEFSGVELTTNPCGPPTNAAIRIEDADRAYVSNVFVKNSAGPGMMTLRSSDSRFEDVKVFCTVRANFYVLDSEHIWIEHGNFQNSGKNNLHLQASSCNTTRDVKVYDSVIRNRTCYGVKIDDSGNTGTIQNISIDVNTIINENGLGRDNYDDVQGNGHDILDVSNQLRDIYHVENGTWKIEGTQMVFYETDGTTEIFRRDLKDNAGNASVTKVFQGIRV